jgi:hypothetical protein
MALPQYATSSSAIAALKELYVDNNDYMRDLVYAENPWLTLVPKNESPDGFAGKYLPVPIQYANSQGRSHTFANAQGNQAPNQYDSFFVYVIQDYQIVTITNLLIEQTKTNAGAFVDEMKREMDGGIRNITNNVAYELFASGTATRGIIAAGPTSIGGGLYTITLTNPQAIVNFEVNMTIQASATDGGAPVPTGTPTTPDLGLITAVNRSTGVITISIVQGAPQSDWSSVTAAYMTVQGDIPTAGGSGSGPLGATGSYLAISGLAAWVPSTDPSTTDSFWGVNRSTDPTRLAGLRYNATAYSIEEGMTNALAFLNREGGRPDLCIMDFASYAALVNSLGAKVQYVEVKHDEVDVAFEGVRFHSAYGYVTVLADRSCPPQTAYVLTTDTWKLRSLGKVPHILTYGIEGLEGLRVGNSDALEVRIGLYGNLVCSAPGLNLVVALSA